MTDELTLNEWQGDLDLAAQRVISLEQQLNEVTVGTYDLLPTQWFEIGLQKARSVAMIQLANGAHGTGWLVAPGVMLTNSHVFPSKNHARSSLISFNYREQIDFSGGFGSDVDAEHWRCQPDELWESNVDLDYSLVKVVPEGTGTDWGFIELRFGIPIEIKDVVNIIQHPEGQTQRMSASNNSVHFVGNKYIQYVTDTKKGSSGSPVFNKSWYPVALHHRGGELPIPSAPEMTFYGNQAVSIDRIIEDLRSREAAMAAVPYLSQ